jgi:hypothetical protein
MRTSITASMRRTHKSIVVRDDRERRAILRLSLMQLGYLLVSSSKYFRSRVGTFVSETRPKRHKVGGYRTLYPEYLKCFHGLISGPYPFPK